MNCVVIPTALVFQITDPGCQTKAFEQSDFWPRYLTQWFTLRLSRSSLKVKVHAKTGRKTVAKVVGVTLSEGFLLCLTVFYVSLFCKHVRLSCVFLIKLLTYHTTQNRFTALFPGPPGWAGTRRELLDFMVQGKINRGRHTDNRAGSHSIRTNQWPPPPSPIFYRPDALLATQPAVSKHWINLLTCFYLIYVQVCK